MAKQIQAIRGMNDILPDQTPIWQTVESILKQIVQHYGYQEIRFPVVEYTDLFHRVIGEATDIVQKEMYTFTDRSGDSLTLRPEGTAGCVRAGLEHGLLYNQIQRLWYWGPLFRHERPQKGRYRQFYQFGVEAFGMATPDIDVEMILIMTRIFRSLGLSDHLTLQVNSLGSTDTRKKYHTQLVDYFSQHQNQLDEDSQKRLHINPLRILDSKNPKLKSLIQQAPKLLEALDQESKTHFDIFCHLLNALKISYEVNPCLVRGLDYYTHTVFEWVTEELGAQGTVCAGGRFDGLIEQLGGKATSAVGLAMGLERVIALVISLKSLPAADIRPDIYLITSGEGAKEAGLKLTEKLRDAIPDLNLILDCAGGSFKNQFKRADKSKARLALVLGEQELENKTVSVKNLRKEEAQKTLPISELESFLKQSLKRA